MVALTDIQNDVKAAVEARDKAQRDVHFMPVEQQKKDDESEINALKAQVRAHSSRIRRLIPEPNPYPHILRLSHQVT